MNDTMMNAETRQMPTVGLNFILKQIAAIQSETGYLHEAIQSLSQMGDGENGECGSPGNLLGQAKAEALRDVVRSREETNKKLLALYTRMYDDCMAPFRRETALECRAEVMNQLREGFTLGAGPDGKTSIKISFSDDDNEADEADVVEDEQQPETSED